MFSQSGRGKKVEGLQQTVYSPSPDATDIVPTLYSKYCSVK